ncbi:MAG: ribulokinase [Planctomycetota bacterium]
MNTPCFLGLDFGTECVRAVIVDINGTLAAVASHRYAHGVIEGIHQKTSTTSTAIISTTIPSAVPIGYALQVPSDYYESAIQAIRGALDSPGVNAEQIAGIGVDFTACTALPVDPAGRWLGERAEFTNDLHAYAKLWKHHGAIAEAEEINQLARSRGELWLSRFGNTTSSEWLHAKWLEVYRKSPAVAKATERFVEAGDWIIEQMTGARCRSACMAGYKGLNAKNARAPREFFVALDEGFANELTKLGGLLVSPGERAGTLTNEFATKTGLRPGTPVSAAIIDAHAALPGLGVAAPGTLVIILGTSGCHILLAERELLVTGIQGVVEDGVVPGLFAYEAGQPAVGDLYAWVSRTTGKSMDELEREASCAKPGASSLLMLDWFNGNRSILVNPELKGVVAGLTLNTTPADLYRAAAEGTAFGTRVIIEQFESFGMKIHNIAVCGGIAEKSPFILQIFADATGRDLHKPNATEVCARGAAICGAAVSGYFKNMSDAARALSRGGGSRIAPAADATKRYHLQYQEWRKLHDAFASPAKK